MKVETPLVLGKIHGKEKENPLVQGIVNLLGPMIEKPLVTGIVILPVLKIVIPLVHGNLNRLVLKIVIPLALGNPLVLARTSVIGIRLILREIDQLQLEDMPALKPQGPVRNLPRPGIVIPLVPEITLEIGHNRETVLGLEILIEKREED